MNTLNFENTKKLSPVFNYADGFAGKLTGENERIDKRSGKIITVRPEGDGQVGLNYFDEWNE